MECRRFFNPVIFREKLHAFLPRLQNRGAKAKPNLETLRIARGLTLLFFSVLLAWTSIELTRQESIEAFQNTHWPISFIWKQTLSDHGLTRRMAIGEYSKLLESNPGAFLGESKIWVSQNACVVFIPKSAYDSGPELWTCEIKPKPEPWKNLGSGLRGFERLVDLFEKFPRKSVISLKKTVKSIDPKEFHY